jgi:hypothetical protein
MAAASCYGLGVLSCSLPRPGLDLWAPLQDDFPSDLLLELDRSGDELDRVVPVWVCSDRRVEFERVTGRFLGSEDD